MHIYFINHLSALHGRPWNCIQANFTVGARGSLKQTQFQDRLRLLGVTNSKARDKIRALTVSKTLALSNIILKLFHVSILRSPEWALSSLPTEVANSQTSAFKLFKKKYRPIQWNGNLRSRIIGPLSPGDTGQFKGPQPTLTAPLSLAHTWVEQSHQAPLICLYVCVYVYVYVCIYIYICICMYACICVCV